MPRWSIAATISFGVRWNSMFRERVRTIASTDDANSEPERERAIRGDAVARMAVGRLTGVRKPDREHRRRPRSVPTRTYGTPSRCAGSEVTDVRTRGAARTCCAHRSRHCWAVRDPRPGRRRRSPTRRMRCSRRTPPRRGAIQDELLTATVHDWCQLAMTPHDDQPTCVWQGSRAFTDTVPLTLRESVEPASWSPLDIDEHARPAGHLVRLPIPDRG